MTDVVLQPKLLQLETYLYTFDDGHTIRWNITQAVSYVQGLPLSAAVPIPRADLQVFVDNNEPDPARYDLVDCRVPGIAAPILSEGAVVYTLIDGNHRAGRALRDGLPFSAYILTDEASRSCIIHCTNWSYVP